MEKRNKYIAVVFIIFILFVPAATLVRGFFPETGDDSSKEQNVLENNGALRGENSEEADGEAADGEAADREEADEEAAAREDAQADDSQATWFAALQNDLGGFTEGLFLRKSLIKMNERMTMFMTGGSYIGSTQVLLGKNNWLFYKREDDGQPIQDYMGINHYTDNELVKISVNLVDTRNYLKGQGIDFYVITVPNKEIVYAENMPDTIVQVNEKSRGEQVADYLKENTDLIFIYPKQAFYDVKDKYQVYYTTDTHWNQMGAFVGMQEIFKEAYGTCAGLDSVEFKIHATDYAGDLALIGDIEDKYGIDTVYVFDAKTADPAQYRDETAIVIGDSFAGFLSIVAEGYYKEVHWVDTSNFTMDMVAKYDADVIIWETGERRMDILRDVSLTAK